MAGEDRGRSLRQRLPLSLVLAPCGTPFWPRSSRSPPTSAAVPLLACGLALGLPMLLVGAAARELARRLDGLGKSAWADRLAGAAVLTLGFYLQWTA